MSRSNNKKNRLTLATIGTGILLASISLITTSCVTANNSTIQKARTAEFNHIENEYEQYINNNSFSILGIINWSPTYITNYFDSFLNKLSQENELYDFVQSLNIAIKQLPERSYTNLSFGTGWIFDYATNSNSNLNTYYIASNIHVYDSSYAFNLQTNSGVNITINVPISQESVNYINYYISQPLGSNKNYTNNFNVPVLNLYEYWYGIGINKDNIQENLIPIGAYSKDGNAPISKKKYDMNIKISGNNIFDTTYYLYSTETNYPIEETFLNVDVDNENPTTDFGLMKANIDPSEIVSKGQTTESKRIFSNLRNIFDVNNNNNVKANSSYINKLNKLLSLIDQNQQRTQQFKNLFLFADEKDISSNSLISIAGFPAIESHNSMGNRLIQAGFNTNSISASLALKDTLHQNQIFATRRNIEYNINGKFGYSKYNSSTDWQLQDVNLKPGSSGSFAMTNDYKILGIYWGVLQNTLLRTTHGIISNLYSTSNSNSIVYRYLRYINKNNTNSKLLELFTKLNNINSL